MKKTARNLQVILSAAAAVFIALSPLIHGLHLVFATHHHNCCNICTKDAASHVHDHSYNCHGHDNIKIIISSPEDNCSGGHDPNTCPLCRQFTQLLKTQIILENYVAITLQDSLREEQVDLPWCFFSISFNNIIPRAPPV